jgi:regulator of CtrA degradation
MATVEFFDRTMMETMALLAESRRYLIDRAETETKSRPVDQGLVSSMETMRLVARLTQVLAWLLTHRAVHAGEMTLWEATRPDRRLGGHTLCNKDVSDEDPSLPEELRRLLQRSLSLYQRIARLDDQVARAAERERRDAAGGGAPRHLS